MQETISSSEAVRLIRSAKGRYFTVGFNKRKDGSFRILTGRVGVSKGVKGDGKSFDEEGKDLLTVSETVQERDSFGRIRTRGIQFRHFGIERLRTLRIGGNDFRVVYDGVPLKKIR
jgi:hypothetical protein